MKTFVILLRDFRADRNVIVSVQAMDESRAEHIAIDLVAAGREEDSVEVDSTWESTEAPAVLFSYPLTLKP